MKRFKSIPGIFTRTDSISLVDYDHFDVLDDTYFVDTSSYVPNREVEKIMAKQAAGQILDSLYDSPDDLTAGTVNMLARKKGVDMAEISQHADRLVQMIKEAEGRQQKRLERAKSSPKAPPVDKEQ